MDRGVGPDRLDLYVLLTKLRAGGPGGCIVGGDSCTEDEITLARAERRLYVDKDGFAYVYRRPTRRS